MERIITVELKVPEDNYDMLVMMFAKSFGWQGQDVSEALTYGQRKIKEWVLDQTRQYMAESQGEAAKQAVKNNINALFSEFLQGE